MKLFGEKTTPRERLRNMVSVVRRQKYHIQRDITSLQAQNKRVEADIKKRAKAGNLDEAKILARELVNSRKAVSRLYSANANLDCIISELNCQAATTKMAGCLKSSTAVMKSMSALFKLPELQKTMRDLSKEMTKMGLIDEMIQDTMESTMGDADDMEEATAAEVEKIIFEITSGEVVKPPGIGLVSVPTDMPIAGGSQSPSELAGSVLEDDEEEMSEMQARLAALRN
ncbi:Charged multivesicular body protein 3 [Clonorchis sinensis]|uniref:Charged multivesicular body protein 3 n=2 Tax=Clonorchis sinensis TaxID=79923 RepID=A0A8T1MC11_CLOSI|nr:Charged multivesicular body protein 3 [Clonorchis sinensis]GAA29015.1 charged multivesicular body protein 3 [Clonorchis sinensis]